MEQHACFSKVWITYIFFLRLVERPNCELIWKILNLTAEFFACKNHSNCWLKLLEQFFVDGHGRVKLLDLCFDFLDQKLACFDRLEKIILCFERLDHISVCFEFLGQFFYCLDPTNNVVYSQPNSDKFRTNYRCFYTCSTVSAETKKNCCPASHRYVLTFSTKNGYVSILLDLFRLFQWSNNINKTTRKLG